MSSWLDPVRRALEAAPRPPTVLVRDDDGGWNDVALARTVDAVRGGGFAIDLAVIPDAVSPALATTLRGWRADGVGVHQHGRRHANHELHGRRCEFGPSRSRAAQRADLGEGRARLTDLLGGPPDPVFTPPWNRCTRDTAECLRDLGIEVLSREHRAEPLGVRGLEEVPVNVDWPRAGRRVGLEPLGRQLAATIATQPHLGLMLHHAAMDDGDLSALTDALAVLRDAEAVPARIPDLAPDRRQELVRIPTSPPSPRRR